MIACFGLYVTAMTSPASPPTVWSRTGCASMRSTQRIGAFAEGAVTRLKWGDHGGCLLARQAPNILINGNPFWWFGTSRDGGLNARRPLGHPHPLMIICTRIRETDQIFAHVENKSADMEKRHDVQARDFRQPPRQQAPHASPAQSGVHASAAAAFPPARQEGN